MPTASSSRRLQPTVVISLDLELAWGSFFHAYGPELLDMARWTHDHGAPILLEQLTRNRLSATWAVVGMVMLDRLPDVSAMTPVCAFEGRDWFSFVPPGADEASAPEWFGASLVRRLREARPRQEIGFHGFSHVILDDAHVPSARARQEIERCAALARQLDLAARSFVFPRNGIAHLDALRAAGMRSFRGQRRIAGPSGVRSLRRAGAVAADWLGLRPSLVQPHVEQGLVDIPGSLMVRHAGGWRRYIPDASRRRRLLKGLERVQREGGIFHVWLHPENLYFERPRLEAVMSDFFSELAELAAASKLRVMTMGEVADEALAAIERQHQGNTSAADQGSRAHHRNSRSGSPVRHPGTSP